jgi:4-alpha-glucanotransferase
MNLIEQLATLVGFHASYTDALGNQSIATDDTRSALLIAMGYDISSDDALLTNIRTLQEQSWRNMLPSVHIANMEEYNHPITISIKSDVAETVHWEITQENGEILTGEVHVNHLSHVEYAKFEDAQFNKFILMLPALEQGYHQLSIFLGDLSATCPLIFAPKTCYSPKEAADYKMWGYAAQLYSLKSEKNWGIGDFGDLQTLIKTTANEGVSAIGLNPLHPLYQNNPSHCSPYSPSSRCFLNTMYIDVTQAPLFTTSKNAKTLINSHDFQEKLSAAKNTNNVDYSAVAEIKYQALEILYKAFTQSRNKALKAEFEAYKIQYGENLLRHCTFETLFEHFQQQGEKTSTWNDWPEAYQDPTSAEILVFQKKHTKRIGYFTYLQWLAHRQLSAAKQLASDNDMPVGLYLDLAVGCDGGGIDVWANKELYVPGAAVGAPPDMLSTLGQDWGLTPINPVELKAQGYQPLVQALRCNMQYAGAIRIDHIIGLMRQYWVAPEMKPNEGIFITYPLDDIFRIIALESRRANCIVIGEDLGTVPDGFGEIMASAGLLSYKVLYFESWETGLFKRPVMYPELSMVTVSTHDLPTLTGWWTGRDLEWRQQLNLYPNPEFGQYDRDSRINNRERLIGAFIDMKVIDEDNLPEQHPPLMNRELTLATQKFLALAPSRIQLIPLEDALEVKEQVNIPGTISEHPNWCQKLPVNIDELCQQDSVSELASMMRTVRPKK